MARIIDLKPTEEGKVICQLLVDFKEALRLQGNLKEVYLFSTDACDRKSGVMETGVNNSTKYFIIPKELEIRLNKRSFGFMSNDILPIYCLQLPSNGQHIFVYVIDK